MSFQSQKNGYRIHTSSDKDFTCAVVNRPRHSVMQLKLRLVPLNRCCHVFKILGF